ncbi:MAG: glycosyltransferase family 39 protein, partial [Bacteroidetes bacterium]|nr:glycosyltransferase family 39 protein [Bacteroidota bacterium]
IQIKTPFGVYDEGFAVFNATRIMNGDIPYKDFWAIYPPGQFYTLAILFKTFGVSLLAARLYDTFVRLIIIISVWLIAKKVTHPTLAYFASITATVMLASANLYTYAVFPALALSLLAILSLLEYMDTEQLYWLFLAGILIGLTFFFRWDIGLYVAISASATIFLFCFFRIRKESIPSGKMLFNPFQIAMVAGTALIVALVGYGCVGLVSGFENLWDQVVVFPTTMLREVRWLPYPMLLPTKSEFLPWIRFYFPLFVYGIAFSYYIYSILKKHIVLNTQYFGSIAIVILGVLLFAQAISRYDYIHVVPTSLMAMLVAFSLLSQNVFKRTNLITKLLRISFLAGLISLYIVLPVIMLLHSLSDFSPLECYSQVERASCVYLQKDQERAIEYVRAHTIENEAIFVGNQRHDLIFINDIGFYFLSARQSASRYHELYPGVATTLPIQQEIVRDIESKNVKWIILVQVPKSTEPNASASSSGIRYLDNFIQSKYLPVETFGNYQILQKITR